MMQPSRLGWLFLSIKVINFDTVAVATFKVFDEVVSSFDNTSQVILNRKHSIQGFFLRTNPG